MADFNLDGLQDIAIANGRVARESPTTVKSGLSAHWSPYGERNQLLANLGNGQFHDVSINSPALCGYHTVARGLACGDIDGDGAPDLLINAVGERARVLRNVVPNRGHWLAVRAIDPASKRSAIGAEIAVNASGVKRTRILGSAQSYLSAGPATAEFGIGSASAYDSIEVVWPDGSKETFPGGASDRGVELRKGAGAKR